MENNFSSENLWFFMTMEVILAKENEVTITADGWADEYLAGYLSEYKVYLYQLYLNNNKKYYPNMSLYEKFGLYLFRILNMKH